MRYDRSILDFVTADAQRLSRSVGPSDRRRLDEYLYGVRDLERRIAAMAERTGALPGFDRPAGLPSDPEQYDFARHARVMFDLLTLALQADLTRVATFMLGHEGSGKAYPEMGVPEAHHALTHHGNDPVKREKVARINRYHLDQFAYFVGRLQALPEGNRSLLENSIVLYGSGISDGNVHDHGNLPVVLAGTAGGRISAGWHRKYAQDTPMTNLYLNLLESLGTPLESLGDATGRLAPLTING